MKLKHIFPAIMFLALSLTLPAQVSNYRHPFTIASQMGLTVLKNNPFAITPELLQIHCLDALDSVNFSVQPETGVNYTFNNNIVTPKQDFTGKLFVKIRLSDGSATSNLYSFEVTVSDGSTVFNYQIAGQNEARIKAGSSYRITPEQIKLAAVPKANKGVFFVSPNGNDNNSGTITAPLKTVEGARLKVYVYKLTVGMPTTGITVYFREGDYYLPSTVSFGSGESGEIDKYITYRAYPFEKVRFTGAKTINPSWVKKAPAEITQQIKKTTARDKIKMIDLKTNGITTYGIIDHVGYGVTNKPIPPANLFINGRAMHLARYPDASNYSDIVSPTTTKGFTSKSGIVKTWQNTGDIWIDGALSKPWEWQKNKISTISPTGVITMAWDYYNNIVTTDAKMFYFNILEELDYPEEFYIDRTKGLLYFYPPADFTDSSTVIMSQSENKLISLVGAKYIQFIDIVFDGTRNSAIEVTNAATGINFINCEIATCGLDGIAISGTNNKILNCHLHDIGANGITLAGGNTTTLEPGNNRVENSKIHDFSQERRAYNPGLNISDVGQIIRNVELYNGPHMAMTVRGNNHIIEYSDFHDAPREYSDMLGIYFNTGNSPLARGTIIRRNKFHDVTGTWKQSAGVYLDNETSGVLIEENYFYNNIAQQSGWSVMVHGDADNIVRKNVFVYCSYPFCISLRLNGYATGEFEGRLDSWSTEFKTKATPQYFAAYPELNNYFDDEGVTPNPQTYTYNKEKDASGTITNYWDRRTPSSNVFKSNLVYNEKTSIFAMASTTSTVINRGYYTVGEFRKINGVIQENLISGQNYNYTSNPGFADYQNRNLNLVPTSGNSTLLNALPHLIKMDFKSICLSGPTGVQYNEFKADSSLKSISILPVTTAQYTTNTDIVTPSAGFTGELRVPVKLKVGTTYQSDTIWFKINVDEALGLEPNAQKKSISVYPNPASTNINISAPLSSNISLFNAAGGFLKQIDTIAELTKLPLDEFESGLYFLKIVTTNEQKTIRFTKM